MEPAFGQVDRQTQGALLDALGRSYNGLGLSDKAETAHRKAWAVRERALGPSHRVTLRSATLHAWALYLSGPLGEARSVLKAALARAEAALGPDDLDTLEARTHVAFRICSGAEAFSPKPTSGVVPRTEHGRPGADREVVEQILGRLKSRGGGLRTLVHEIVQGRAFRWK